MIEEHAVDAGGISIRYLTAGEGPPLVLLHALGESAFDWRWVMPALGRSHRIYAPDLPGFGGSGKPHAGYTPACFRHTMSAFLDAVGVERAAVAGNSLGGLVALRLALEEPERVSSLCLVGSAGLGREVTYALRFPALPGYGEAAITLGKTPPGAAARAYSKAGLLFARPYRAPRAWLSEQCRLAQQPGFLEAALSALRAQVSFNGQREVLPEELPRLEMPALVIWGALDRVFPVRQARDAARRLRRARLALIPDCGHLPQIEHPPRFAAELGGFLAGQGG